MALQLTPLENGVLSADPHTVLSAVPMARQIPAGAGWLYQVGIGPDCSLEVTLSPPPSTAWLCSHILFSLLGRLAHPVLILLSLPPVDWHILSPPRFLTLPGHPPLPCLYLTISLVALDTRSFDFLIVGH